MAVQAPRAKHMFSSDDVEDTGALELHIRSVAHADQEEHAAGGRERAAVAGDHAEERASEVGPPSQEKQDRRPGRTSGSASSSVRAPAKNRLP